MAVRLKAYFTLNTDVIYYTKPRLLEARGICVFLGHEIATQFLYLAAQDVAALLS